MKPGLRRLFVDDFHLAEIRNLRRVMNQPEKHPANPVLKPDRPWEGNYLWASNSAIYDPVEKLFKLWYCAGERSGYAVSTDAVHWEKPILNRVEFEGSKHNNLIDKQVFHILSGPDDFGPAEPENFYRTIAWSPDLGQHVKTSPDGFAWREIGKCKVLGAGDTFLPVKTTRPLTGNPDELPGYPAPDGRSRYLGVARWCMPVGRFSGSSDLCPTRRVQALLQSDDLLHWDHPVRILTPDDLDDEMAHPRIDAALADGSLIHDCREDHRCEFYNVLIIPYEELYFALLLVFDPSYDFHRMNSNNQAGPGHYQLAASRDLVHWIRLGDREPFIPRGKFGQHDWAMAWYASQPIVKDGKLHFIYQGNCTTHGGTRDKAYWQNLQDLVDAGEIPAIGSLGLATLRRDGFISLDAGTEPGFVLTKPFQWPGGSLHLNTDARGGEVRVTLCQPDGTPYPGYELSDPIQTNALDAEVFWQGRTTQTAADRHTHGTVAEAGAVDSDDYQTVTPGKWVRLKINAQNARLFSFWFQ